MPNIKLTHKVRLHVTVQNVYTKISKIAYPIRYSSEILIGILVEFGCNSTKILQNVEFLCNLSVITLEFYTNSTPPKISNWNSNSRLEFHMNSTKCVEFM